MKSVKIAINSSQELPKAEFPEEKKKKGPKFKSLQQLKEFGKKKFPPKKGMI